MTLSLKAEILEKLHLRKGDFEGNAKTAIHDFVHSHDKRFKGKSKKDRIHMALGAAGAAARGESAVPAVKVGDKVMYEGKQAVVRQINESSGMAVVKLPRMRDPKIVRLADLAAKQALTEGVIGIAAIGPTYKDMGPSQFIRTDLSPEDIGLEIIGLREDEDTGEEDDQEESSDNGSNIRHDGHTGKKEVDELPTPSDTIATAYSSEKEPKIISKPLSTEPGYTVAKDPNFDGYDYPADAPDIPKADFEGEDNGNSRAPDYAHNVSDEFRNNQYKKKEDRADESFRFMAEMDDMLGHEDREPHKGDTITVTLPAMASIVCTVAKHMGADVQPGGHDEAMLKSMIESLAEVGHGKTIDMPDLEAVASHMNGEETHEIENREGGNPDHQGMAMGDHSHMEPKHEPADHWPGDGDKTNNGKTKLMGGGVAEVAEANFFGAADVMEGTQLTDEEELRMIKRRAGLRFW